MADDDIKGATGSAKGLTGPTGSTGASGATGSTGTSGAKADAGGADELRTGLDGALDSVRKETAVRDGVRVMADRLANLFTDAAIEGPDAAEKLAVELRKRENEFADAVDAHVPKNDAGGDAPFKAPAPATDADVERLEALNHAEPHNDAAAAAVDAGMDTKTANEMTTIGSNI